jgi:UV DNA damage endonuclease
MGRRRDPSSPFQETTRMFRLGLCCAFRDQPIKFGNTTAAAVGRLSRPAALAKLAALCTANAEALLAALHFCASAGIGCFRVNSQILPLKTHPQHGYDLPDLPGGDDIVRRFQECGEFARRSRLRTCLHPDQFVVLNSPREEVVLASIAELEYQAEVAGWVGADVVNVHGGGAFGDKRKALAAFARGLERLSPRARGLLTVENDDKVYTPADLLPLCRAEGVPLVYDAHHHRCNPDGLSVEEATAEAAATWGREPLFHISSPAEGWGGPRPERHHDFIDAADFPECWRGLDITVEVEARAKEVAVLKLRDGLGLGSLDPPAAAREDGRGRKRSPKHRRGRDKA